MKKGERQRRELLIRFRGDKTQNKIAQEYGVTQQEWSYWETGKQNPNTVMMRQLEKDSGIPMEDLFPDVFNNSKLLKGAS